MFLGVLYRFLESSFLAEGYIEELDPIFLSILVSHTKEFFEVFFR